MERIVKASFQEHLRNNFLDKSPSVLTAALGIIGALDHYTDLKYISVIAPKLGQAEKFEVERPEVWKPYV